MDKKELLEREDNLSNWRLVSLLAFNAFLIPALNVEDQSLLKGVEWMIPLIGFLITGSFLIAMCIGVKQKYRILRKWGKGLTPMGRQRSKRRFYAEMMIGPFMLSPTILLVFWLFMLVRQILKYVC